MWNWVFSILCVSESCIWLSFVLYDTKSSKETHPFSGVRNFQKGGSFLPLFQRSEYRGRDITNVSQLVIENGLQDDELLSMESDIERVDIHHDISRPVAITLFFGVEITQWEIEGLSDLLSWEGRLLPHKRCKWQSSGKFIFDFVSRETHSRNFDMIDDRRHTFRSVRSFNYEASLGNTSSSQFIAANQKQTYQKNTLFDRKKRALRYSVKKSFR